MEPVKIPQPPHKQVDDETIVSDQEFGDLLSSLPKARIHGDLYQYKYKEFWFPLPFLKGAINCQKHFQPRKNDILLVTAPKAGTTWMKSIIYALINREIHPPQDTDHPLLHKAPRDLVPLMEFLDPSEYDSVCNTSDTNTRIFASHIPLACLPKSITDNGISSNCKIVYLCRDIKDTFVSTFHFVNNIEYLTSPISLEDAFDLYCKGNLVPAGPVWDQIAEFWKESLEKPDKVMFMKYEEMKIEPKFQLKRLAQFLGKPFSQEEENSGLVDQIISLCSFETMSNLEVNNSQKALHGISNKAFSRNGLVGEGKIFLPAYMASKFDQITEEKFSGSGLSL